MKDFLLMVVAVEGHTPDKASCKYFLSILYKAFLTLCAKPLFPLELNR